MENFYNVKISFKGERDFNFILPGYGELTVYAGKDVFVKGLSVQGVEALRQLRPLLLDHQLNAKPDGCYRVIDLTTRIVNKRIPVQPVQKPVQSVADLKNDMIKNEGPLDPNEGKEPEAPVVEEAKEVIEEPKTEEPKEEAPKATKSTTKKSTSKKSNTKKKTSKK